MYDDEVGEAIAEMVEVTQAGVEVDGELQVAESTWVIYGHANYDGEVILGQFHDAAEAAEVYAHWAHPSTKGSS